MSIRNPSDAITAAVKLEAARLNHIIANLGESKNSRNAAISLLNKLERDSGLSLRTA